jgi:chromosomal replication initiator protein
MNSILRPPVAPLAFTDEGRMAAPVRWSDFLVLPENRSAVRAARAVARGLLAGRRVAFPILVLHGPPGTGKTHLTSTLLRHLGNAPDVLTARTVAVGDLARAAASDDEAVGFADRDLLACDLLVLEDVQHLPAREADAVCDLLDRRAARRKAVVATASAGPAALDHLPRRLTSRLASGLVVQLEPLSPTSRRVLLAEAARLRRLRLTPDALDWLAGHGTGGGVRPLLGLLGNLAHAAPSYPGPLDRTACEEILSGTGQPTSAGRDVSGIVRRVAAAFGVGEKELLGASRLRRVLVPRQVAMYLARELCGLSLPRLGAAFGGRDHTTVLHACRKVEADLAADDRLAGVVRQLRAELG